MLLHGEWLISENQSRINRSIRSQIFFKIDFTKNFTNLTEKHLCVGVSFFFKKKTPLFLIKLQAFQSKACKKETLAQVFHSEFCEISKNTFFTEHLWATASECMNVLLMVKGTWTGPFLVIKVK